MTISDDLLVDVATLRSQVRDKYRDVALDPHGAHHFHTGRALAARLGYEHAVVDGLPCGLAQDARRLRVRPSHHRTTGRHVRRRQR